VYRVGILETPRASLRGRHDERKLRSDQHAIKTRLIALPAPAWPCADLALITLAVDVNMLCWLDGAPICLWQRALFGTQTVMLTATQTRVGRCIVHAFGRVVAARKPASDITNMPQPARLPTLWPRTP
jgi:hypothetical protein